jgi:type IV secretory pathway VirD2 relaxase
MILRHSYTRRRDTARAALRYYQMRPRGRDEPPRAIFGKGGTLTRDEAYRLLDDHQARGYLAHRLMLSPSDEERPEDLRAMTYRVMRDLEGDTGRTLAWVAVEHRNTDQPHVHIVLAGGGERGRGFEEVRLGPADHARMKTAAIEYCRLEARVRDGWERALDGAAHDETTARTPIRSRAGHGDDRDDWNP